MTLTEKLLARAAGKPFVQSGDNIWVNADVLMTHDVCGPGTIGVFKREFGQDAKVWDQSKIVIIPDHYIFTADSKSNRNVDILRDFAKEQALPYFYDVIDDPNGHWVFDAEKGNRKRQYGSRVACCGGIDVHVLASATEDEVRAYTRKVIEACAPGGGWTLGSGNSVANCIPVANFLAMLDEGRKVGVYG